MDQRIWIGLSTSSTFLGWAIRKITRQKASHAWIGYWDATLDQRMVMESTASGYRIITWNRWVQQDNGKRVWVYVYNGDLSSALVWIASFLGTAYDVRFLFWNGLRALFKRWFRRPHKSPNKLACSEAVVRMLQNAKAVGLKSLDPEATNPGELLRFLSENNRFHKITVDGLPNA